MTDYPTSTPLVKKLGLKDGMRAMFIESPLEYFDWLGEPFPEFELAEDELDFIHIFTNEHKELKRVLSQARSLLKPKGMLWISWYKKSSKKETELTGDIIRNEARAAGYNDAKVCSISEDWSALKFVIRK